MNASKITGANVGIPPPPYQFALTPSPPPSPSFRTGPPTLTRELRVEKFVLTLNISSGEDTHCCPPTHHAMCGGEGGGK